MTAVEIAAVVAAGATSLGVLPRVRQVVLIIARTPFVIDRMFKEFAPNGGTTIKDQLNSLQTKTDATAAAVTELVHRVDTHLIDAGRDEGRLSVLERVLGPRDRR